MSKRSVRVSGWAVLSAVVSGLVALSSLLLHRDSLFSLNGVNASPVEGNSSIVPEAFLPNIGQAFANSTAQLKPASQPELGPRHQLTHEQWVALLEQEAKVVAEKRPADLHVLVGDSLSLWFPPDLLPTETTWLNQGISGETSAQLLQRLDLFDDTNPEMVFVMIGINDLRQGMNNATLLANQQAIVRYLRTAHPQARIIVQSMLPHAGDRLLQQPQASHSPDWVARLVATPNARIRTLNQKLAAIAQAEGAEYLDLYSAFADFQGALRPELTTDGLHLSRQGYEVWRNQLDDFFAKRARITDTTQSQSDSDR